MKIGFVGLGKMGNQIVRKLLTAGIEVVAYDRDPAAVALMASIGAVGAKSADELVAALGEHPIIWLMVPSNSVDQTITTYASLLPQGALIVDGGNSDYRSTLRRAKELRAKGISLVDVGTGGGVLGATNGYSLMVGSTENEFQLLTPLFTIMAAPHGGYRRIGEVGYGHYVKMVHDGVEYAIMQALAEGYQVLHEGPLKGLPLTEVASIWQEGSIVNSTLNEIVMNIMKENPELDGIEGYVATSGEGKWTQETALACGIPTPALDQAVAVREASQAGMVSYATKLLAAIRSKFGGYPINN